MNPDSHIVQINIDQSEDSLPILPVDVLELHLVEDVIPIPPKDAPVHIPMNEQIGEQQKEGVQILPHLEE
jgi:hypothetical protein